MSVHSLKYLNIV